MQAVTPVYSRTPGEIRAVGPALGEHNAQIYTEIGLSPAELENLARRRII